MRKVLWLLALVASPAWARPPIERSIEIHAPPEVLYELLTDLESWGEWTRIGPGVEDGPFVAVRGEPYERGQTLRWAGGHLGMGRVRVTDAHPGHIGFELARTSPAGFGVSTWTRWRQTTMLTWQATDGGTTLTWSTVPHNITARPRGVGETLDAVLADIKAAAEAAPPIPVHQAARVVEASGLTVWRGFEQQWTYNHRINRLGSWITAPECAGGACAAELGHSVASGSGADQAQLTDLADLVRAPDLRVFYGTSTLWFSGREGQELVDGECTALPGATGGTALLSGFDLSAIRSAHALWALGVQVEHEVVEGVEVLCVSGNLQMACRTAECRRDRFTEYVMEVRWAYAEAPGLTATPHQAPRLAYAWRDGDLRDMLQPADFHRTQALQGTPGLPMATAGFASLSLELDAPLHTRSLSMALRPQGYDPDAGVLSADLQLFYQQWGPVEIAPFTVAQLSKPGRATFDAGLVLLQLDEGCVTPVEQHGVAFWPGGRLGNGSSEAEVRHVVPFPGCDPAPAEE